LDVVKILSTNNSWAVSREDWLLHQSGYWLERSSLKWLIVCGSGR